jgi:hypothetical protein
MEASERRQANDTPVEVGKGVGVTRRERAYSRFVCLHSFANPPLGGRIRLAMRVRASSMRWSTRMISRH